LRILAWTFVFQGTNYALWSILTAADRQGQALRCAAIALGANVVLNLALIPWLQHNGAALALVITEMVASALMIHAARDVCGPGALASLWWRPGLAAGLAIGAATALSQHSLALAACAAFAALGAVVLVTRALTADEWRAALAAIGSRGAQSQDPS
jgi:O-antigen/teichoic acid export membrane protein